MATARNLIANLAGQGWTMALNLAAVPVYIALLGVESFGLIGLNAVAIALVALLDAGMATTLNREMVRYRAGHLARGEAGDLLHSAGLALGCGGAVLAGLAILGGPALARIWLEPGTLPQATVESAVVLMILAAILRVIETIYRGALLGLDRAVLMNGLSIVSAAARVLGPAMVLGWSGGTVLTFFHGQFLVGVVSLLVFALAAHGVLRPGRRSRFRLASLRRVAPFAGGAFAVSAVMALLGHLDKVVLARLASLETVGYYTSAGIVAAGIHQLVLPAFHSLYPQLSQCDAKGEHERFRRLLLRAALIVSSLAAAPVALMVLNAEVVLYAWTGDHALARHAAPLLAVLAPGALAYALFHALLAGLLAAHQQRLAAVTGLPALAVMGPLMVAAFGGAGPQGVAAGWALGMAVWLLATLLLTHRHLGSGAPLVPLAVCLAGPCVAAFAVAALFGLLPGAGAGVEVAGRLPAIAFVTLAGGGTFVATALAARELDSVLNRRPLAEAA